MIPAHEALERLKAGNARFTAQLRSSDEYVTHARRPTLPIVQEPFAIIFGCSDARVPAELVFDQGLGDLFVIRVAGNIVAPSLVGSVEFAAERFRTRLVVVLGHSRCGAIEATLEELRRPTANQSRNLRGDRRARAAVGRRTAADGRRPRSRRARARGDPREHQGVGESPAARIRRARAARPDERPDGRRSRVLRRDRAGRGVRRLSECGRFSPRTACRSPRSASRRSAGRPRRRTRSPRGGRRTRRGSRSSARR